MLETGLTFSRKEAIQELWRRGHVAPWYLRVHQHSLYEMLVETVRDIVVPNISRRFGKSTTCVVYCIEQALYKKQDIRYATAFLTDLQGFIKPIFDSVLSSCPDELRPVYKESKKTYFFPSTGATIKLVGLDKNPNGIRGNAVDILIIDEAAFVDKLEYLYKSIIVPATADRQFKIIFPSTPPMNPDHFWSLNLIPKAISRGTYLEFTLDDNTHLDEKEKERLLDEVGGKDSPTAQREFYCKIIRDPESIVIPEYSVEKHVKKLTPPQFVSPMTFLDFGGSMDKHGILICYWDFERAKFCVYREILLPKNTGTGKIIKDTVKIEENSFGKELRRFGDAPEQLRIDLSIAGFHCSAPKKEKGSLEANISAVRIGFTHDTIEIDEQCTMLQKTLEFGEWLPTRKDWKRTEELGHLDLLAALLYAYKHIDKSNPIPAHIGRSLDKVERPVSNTENFLLEGF